MAKFKISKKIISMFLVLTMVFSSGVSVFATNSSKRISDFDIYGSDVVCSEILTYDEVLKEIAKDKGISVKQAKELLSSGKNNTEKSILENSHYRILSKRVTVTNEYKPKVKIYVEISTSQYHWGVKDIIHTSLDLKYKKLQKKFSGEIYTNLENPSRIYCNINGDFFNYKIKIWKKCVNIDIGELARVFYNISHSSNFYEYIDEDFYITCGH